MKKSLLLLPVLLTTGCLTSSAYVNKIDSTGLDVKGNYKSGKACTYFNIFGDRTIKAAAENGNIRSVKYVEESANPFRACYTVYGD